MVGICSELLERCSIKTIKRHLAKHMDRKGSEEYGKLEKRGFEFSGILVGVVNWTEGPVSALHESMNLGDKLDPQLR